MAYFQPYIDASGLHIPTYIDIRDDLIEQCKNIFGQDLYLGEDTQDYQWICANAEKEYDTLLAAQLAYNNRGPGTGIGSGLDGIVKVNGIKRKKEEYSKCHANVAGVPGEIITGAIALDKGNIRWDLPDSIIVPESGIAENLLLTCEIPGPIEAAPGDIVQMFNPQYGWNGIVNTDNAELGSYIEDDGRLRGRQQTSVALPSLTELDGIKGAIAQIERVTRYQVYENDTNLVDANGLPPHSITAVIEGGDSQVIANTLFLKKTPGCYTNGTTEVQITDADGNLMWDAFNKAVTKRFYRPSYVDIDVAINVKKLLAYTDKNTSDIKTKVAEYLSGLAIGTNLSISSIWGAALSAMSDLRSPAFSIVSVTAARHEETLTLNDIKILFYEVTRGKIENIVVNPI